ncbi:MAG: ATP-binding protein [Anaerolineae bacterium]|jgi:PAS domain S-box-containing protein|nr:ATP-binding protein [Anaerolineae bacterium]MDH7475312.1 ATP-binding protein [Anaerolineae bacterium]
MMEKLTTTITSFGVPSRRQGKVAFAIGCWVICALVFAYLYHVVGMAATAVGILPVIVMGWFFGVRAGLFGSLLLTLLMPEFVTMVGDDGWNLFVHQGLPGFAVTVLSGVVVGWLHNLSERLRQQIAERERAEEALRQLNDELELRIEEQTAELAQANEQLREEIAQRQRAEEAVRRSEALLRSLIESLPQNVFSKDLAGRFTFANQRYCLTEGKTLADILGKTDFDLHPPELAEKYREDDLRIMETGQVFKTVEEHQPIGGEKFYVQVIKTPLYDAAGQVAGVLGVFWDVTAQKRAEEALQTYAAELERSNRELKNFLYVASHDLQEPLRKVRAFGDRLQAKYGAVLDAQGCDYLERMQNAAARMQDSINALLVYSRVTTRAQPFEKVNLAAMVPEVVSGFKAQVEGLGGRVEVGDLPVIEADPNQMRQLLQHLVSNALKFHREEEPPLVRIHARAIDREPEDRLPGDEWYQIIVQDNGIGFEEKYVERIFQPFQRLHGRGQYEGPGMGLAICRKIVERHRGTITAKSAPGQGATFIITLPARQPVKEAAFNTMVKR